MGPLLKWMKQFECMKEKLKEAIHELKDIEVVIPIAYIFHNVYLCKKVYFGCRIIILTEKQEKELTRIHELIILWKLRLSEKFP